MYSRLASPGSMSVIDSDRDAPSSPLKKHAARLRDEMGVDGGLVWVTAGREVENYVDGTKLQAALKELHPQLYHGPCATGPFDHAFYFWRDDPKQEGKRMTYKDADKVGAASRVCAGKTQLDILDLRERLNELAEMIQKANGLPRK